MHRLTPEHFVEWLAVSLRWMSLMGLAVWFLIQGGSSFEIGVVLAAGAIWNLSLTFLGMQEAFIGGSIRIHRLLTIALDILLANLVFFFSNTQAQQVWWAGILPIMTGALYFSGRGLIAVIVICLASLGTLTFLSFPLPDAGVTISLLALTSIIFGLLFYFISNRLKTGLITAARLQAKTSQETDRIENEQKRFLYNLVASLSATLNYQRVLETALDLSAAAMTRSSPAADPIVNAVLLFTQKENNETGLKVGSARRFTPADQRIELAGKSGLLGRAIDSGEASLTNDLGKDTELNRVIALRACQSAYCVPLRNGLDTYGVMLFAHPDEAYFTEERRDILDTVGHQAMIAKCLSLLRS
jgi:hypothetical protein